jgi:PKD repeat protein
MVHSHGMRTKTLIGSAMVLLALLALLAVAPPHAFGAYGELARVGETTPGTGNGQFNEERTRLLGVDPTDNSVYVLDEPQRYTQAKEEKIDPETKACEVNEITGKCVKVGVGPITRHFRLQKFTESKGKYSFVASVSFDETTPEAHSGSYLAQGVEGLAVDPKLKRVYLLTVGDRETGLTIDNKRKAGAGLETEGLLVATTLHAFSTEASGSELVPASGTKETAEQGKGVLVGPSELHAQSVQAGQALLQPTGITVDPTTDEVIVLAHVDEKGEATDSIQNAADHYALQRIGQSGTLGARYIDKTNALKEGSFTDPPDSPIVIPGATEHVYLNHEGLTEIPYDFSSSEAPHRVSSRLGESNATATGPRSSYSRGASAGGSLSVSPDGTVYASGEIKSEETGVGTDFRPGVLSFNAAGVELGWTGGQTPLLEGNKDKCALQPELEELIEIPLRIAAGSGGKVFVLSPEFLKRWEGEEVGTEEEEEERAIEGDKTKGAHFQAVVEFGPGGTGCPQASATPPTAEVNGKALTEKESVASGVAVTFSSTVKQGDALKVKWEFSNGSVTETETTSTDQYQLPSVKHKFEHEGSFTVKATIETDNLDTPTLTVEATEKVVVTGSPPPPPAALEGPSSALVSQSVQFTDPNPSGLIKKYKWSFGDGAKAETETPAVKHSYTAPGEYTVELRVANAQGTESAPASKKIKITEPAKEEHKEEPPKEGPKPLPPEETPPAPPSGDVKGSVENKPPAVAPNAVLAKTSAAVTPAGAVPLSVSCPAGASSCAGTVTLKTLGAVSATKSKKKAVLVLAVGSFSVVGGHVKTITLHLSAKAKKLLAKSHVLRARATILAHDSTGLSHTSLATVTLRAAKARKH